MNITTRRSSPWTLTDDMGKLAGWAAGTFRDRCERDAAVEVGGRRLRPGRRVLPLTHTANEAHGGFDLDRPEPVGQRQLRFGAGRHFCLGAPVGRRWPAWWRRC
ncbi:hypothetical protein [Dactylosporangium sp. CA-092794]|uniref:hypothetical protein n=1 Tax=Dactylosporangium sp. CA-092794 TaxID=3239929 RepID=UPI003D8AED1F